MNKNHIPKTFWEQFGYKTYSMCPHNYSKTRKPIRQQWMKIVDIGWPILNFTLWIPHGRPMLHSYGMEICQNTFILNLLKIILKTVISIEMCFKINIYMYYQVQQEMQQLIRNALQNSSNICLTFKKLQTSSFILCHYSIMHVIKAVVIYSPTSFLKCFSILCLTWE